MTLEEKELFDNTCDVHELLERDASNLLKRGISREEIEKIYASVFSWILEQIEKYPEFLNQGYQFSMIGNTRPLQATSSIKGDQDRYKVIGLTSTIINGEQRQIILISRELNDLIYADWQALMNDVESLVFTLEKSEYSENVKIIHTAFVVGMLSDKYGLDNDEADLLLTYLIQRYKEIYDK